MRYLLLIILAVSTVQAQDSRETLEARIDSIDVEIERSKQDVVRLGILRNMAVRELARVNSIAEDKLVVSVKDGGWELYRNPSTLRGSAVMATTGYVSSLYEDRFFFTGTDGESGWIYSNAVQFEEDPTSYIAWLNITQGLNEQEQAVIDKKVQERQDNLDWEVTAATLRQLAAAEQAAHEQREAEIKALEATLAERGVVGYIQELSFETNSAGGIEPAIEVKNLSGERIKYTRVKIAPFNSVGDPAVNSTGGQMMDLNMIGPIPPRAVGTYSYEDDPPYYSGVATCFELISLNFELFDGTMHEVDVATARPSGAYKIAGECAVK